MRAAAPRTEHAKDVVRLGQGALVFRSLREHKCLGREALRALTIARAMGRETPVREDPRLRGWADRGLARGRVVPLRVGPVPAPMVDLGKLVFDLPPRFDRHTRDRLFVAL